MKESCSLVGCAKLANKTFIPPSAPQASAGTPNSRHQIKESNQIKEATKSKSPPNQRGQD
jgi:hypothetical protein